MSMEIDSVSVVDSPSLQFNEQLVGTRAIKADILIRRLKALHEELKGFEQQQVEQSSLENVSKDLIHKSILRHNNSTVTALAACCLADILRLFAPDAPYDTDILKSIFELFIDQLSRLNTNNKADFEYQFYVLESLSTVESIVLLADFPEAGDMLTQLFQHFFKTIETRLPQNVQVYMTDILRQLIDESVALSEEAVELLLEHLASNNNSYQHLMAMDLCRASPVVLQRRVCQYFNDTLMAVSHGSEEGMDYLKRVHGWLQKIYYLMPSLLLSVVPQLEEEMTLDELKVRELATETIGNMLSDKSSTLYRQYPSIWKSWMGRTRDKSTSIRIRLADMACTVYQHHPDIVASKMNESLLQLLVDSEEKVRAAACSSIGKMDIDTIIEYVTEPVLKQVAMRCKDRKSIVQKEAMNAIGKIYDQVYSHINDQHIMKKFGWIPCELFHCLLVDNLRVTLLLDETILKYILPENMDDVARSERLVTVYVTFDDKARKAFDAFIIQGNRHIAMMERFLELCDNDAMDSEISDYEQVKLDELMKQIAVQFEDHARVISSLRQIHEVGDIDVVRALRNSISVEKEYRTILNSQKSLLRKMEKDMHGSLEPCRWILNRTHLLALNKSTVPYLYSALRSTRGNRQSAVRNRSDAAKELLTKIAQNFPKMCITYHEDFIRSIMNDNDSSLANHSLEIMASITKSLPNDISISDGFFTRLSSYARAGDTNEAKNASTIICNSIVSDYSCTDLVEQLTLDTNLEDENLVTTLTSLSVFALYSPSLVQPHIDMLFEFVQDKCLPQALIVSDPDNNPEWEEYDDLWPISKQKIAAVPILTNHLIGMAKIKQSVHEDSIKRVTSILWVLLDTTCDMAAVNRTNAAETSHLRLLAAEAIIELAEYPPYYYTLDISHFEQLGFLSQDSCYFVRRHFGESLMLGLLRHRIHPRYYALLFLYAHEPDNGFLKQVSHFIRSRAASIESVRINFELSIVRLIHLLAHHPDFPTNDEELYQFSVFFDFYISCIVTQENITNLYHCIQKIKISVDAINEDESKKSHILCDLACLLFERKSKRSNWQIESGQQSTTLHSKLYRLLPPGPIQKAALERSYLPVGLIQRIQNEQPQKGIEKRSRPGMFGQNAIKKTRKA